MIFFKAREMSNNFFSFLLDDKVRNIFDHSRYGQSWSYNSCGFLQVSVLIIPKV